MTTELTALNQYAPKDLDDAYENSYYTILGAGGDLDEWINGYNALLQESGIGTPEEWFTTTGKEINEYAAIKVGAVTNPFADNLTVLMFRLDGLNASRLAIFKLRNQDRWFEDIVDNMTEHEYEEDDSDDGE
jgi:hypothetical protein